jgi:hypothetical protein
MRRTIDPGQEVGSPGDDPARTSPARIGKARCTRFQSEEAALSTREETDSVAIVADAEIRPFHVEVPQEQIEDLRRRIQTTRWPEAFRSLR